MSLNFKVSKIEPFKFTLDLTILKSKGFLGKCGFPQSPGLLALFRYVLALEWCAAATFTLNRVIMNVSTQSMQVSYLQFFCKKTFSATRPQSHLHQLIHSRLVTWENWQIKIVFPSEFTNYFNIEKLINRFYTGNLGTKGINLQFHSDFISKLLPTGILSFYTKPHALLQNISPLLNWPRMHAEFAQNIMDSLQCHLDQYLTIKSVFLSCEQALLFVGD